MFDYSNNSAELKWCQIQCCSCFTMQIRNLPARVAQLLKRRCSSMNVITTSSQRHHTPYSEESEWLVLFSARSPPTYTKICANTSRLFIRSVIIPLEIDRTHMNFLIRDARRVCASVYSCCLHEIIIRTTDGVLRGVVSTSKALTS